jgi:type I restriction enzyme S subunit
MNADRLLALYEKVAEAPNAVPRLRRFVLDLAVRGKLVPQDAGDEPASELLKRIAAEKARLVKAGEFREPRNSVEIKRNELSFAPPAHWAWARLIDIARPSYGFAFKSSQFNGDKRGMPLVRIRDISKADTEAYYEGDYDPAYLVRAGDYLVGMDGDFNLRCWAGPDGLLNQRVMRINRWRCEVDPEFVKLPLQMVLDYLHGDTSLTTVKHLSAKQVNGIEIPVPPFAEQRRIVGKVEELMALLDRLEAARTAREATRDRLTAASLTCLTAPDADVADFPINGRFALATLTALTTRAGQIKPLRQTILNLAVRGKLVGQDPSDEPASELLKRIAAEKARLLKAKKVLGQTAPSPDPERAITTPRSGWNVIALGDVLNFVTSGSRGWSEYYADTGPFFVRAQNIRFGQVLLDNLAQVQPPSNSEGSRTQVAKGDVLIVITGAGVTNPAVLDRDIGEAYVSQHVGLARPIDPETSRWLLLCLMADCGGRSELVERAYGAGRPGLNLDNIRSLTIPLPPLAEQHRIVAKVDALMALCDRLEVALTTADSTRARLLEALLNVALEPAAPAVTDAAE